MRKRILVLVIAAGFAACNSNPKTDAETPKVTSEDTANSSQSALNDKTPVMQMNGVNDTLISKDGSEYVKLHPETSQPAAINPVVKAAPNHAAGSTHTGSSSHTVTSSSQSSGTSTETASAPVAVKKKKKISNAVKGTVIGAASGAVIGAVVSKKKGTGAVVGGVLGAGAGYIIGHKKDKKQQQQ